MKIDLVSHLAHAEGLGKYIDDNNDHTSLMNSWINSYNSSQNFTQSLHPEIMYGNFFMHFHETVGRTNSIPLP